MFHKLAKRELASYALLLKYKELNYGDAIDLLRRELYMTKKVASNTLRRLRRLNLIQLEKREDSLVIKPVSPELVLEKTLNEYKENRRKRSYALAKIKP